MRISFSADNNITMARFSLCLLFVVITFTLSPSIQCTPTRTPTTLPGTASSWPWLKQLKDFDAGQIKSFAIYNKRIFIVTTADRVYGYGSFANNAMLGLGNATFAVTTPTELVELRGQGVVKFASGYDHMLAMTSGGRVWSFGQNDRGQLGIGTTADHFRPVLVPNLTKVIDVECGEDSSYALTSANELYVWGHNYYGQLGIGNLVSQRSPVKLTSLANIVAIETTQFWHQVMALTTNGQVYCWGEQFPSADYQTTPKLIDVGRQQQQQQRVQSIDASENYGYLLTEAGQIYFKKSGQNATLFYEGDVRFRAIFPDRNIIYGGDNNDLLVAQSVDDEIFVWKLVDYGRGNKYYRTNLTLVTDAFAAYKYPPTLSFMVSLKNTTTSVDL